MNFKNQNQSYIGREMTINLYTSTVLSYLKPLKLKSCKGNKIRDTSKFPCYKKLNKMIKNSQKIYKVNCILGFQIYI